MSENRALRLAEEAIWRDDKMGKATLFKSEALMLGLNALEPGQAHAPHAHAGSDKAYLVIEGQGLFQLAGQSHEMGPGELLVAPSGVEHGVSNESEARLLVFVMMSPPPS